MLNKSLLLLITLCCALSAWSQVVETNSSPTPSPTAEEDVKLKARSLEFLRETLGEVNNMRTLENRISFTSELASLMWFENEQEARNMYGNVSNDFRQLLANYDGQLNALGEKSDDENMVGPMMFDPSERSKLEKKLTTAMAVRQQVAMTMIEHDPDLALDFYYGSINVIANQEIRKRYEESDRYFLFQLLDQITDKDAGKIVKFASRSLEQGFKGQHLTLLHKIYNQNPESAIVFAADILSSIKSNKDKADMWAVNELLEFGDQTLVPDAKNPGKKPIYGSGDLRDLAEILAQDMLSKPAGEMGDPSSMPMIAKYAPGRVAQIKARFRSSRNSYPDGPPSVYTGNSMASSYGMASNSNMMSKTSAAQKLREESEKNQQQMMDDVQKVGNKDLPKEQRDEIISRARMILLTTPGRDKKVMGLGLLAAQVAKAGDKDLAAQIMRDAESLVNPDPRNYQDFMLTWMLASGYASANPDKAFPLLQDTISRANDTLSAFVKVAEFIDVNADIIQDGEVQVGAFGGSMVRGLTRELTMADSTIRVLAKVDFEKTRELTNRFDRPEIRVLAKMMVLRAVLADKATDKPENDGSSYPIY